MGSTVIRNVLMDAGARRSVTRVSVTKLQLSLISRRIALDAVAQHVLRVPEAEFGHGVSGPLPSTIMHPTWRPRDCYLDGWILLAVVWAISRRVCESAVSPVSGPCGGSHYHKRVTSTVLISMSTHTRNRHLYIMRTCLNADYR